MGLQKGEVYLQGPKTHAMKRIMSWYKTMDDIKYIHTENVHNLAAPSVVVPLVMKLVKPSSVLDVGCGTGTWLKVFRQQGIKDVIGVDGDYVNRSQLVIDETEFRNADLMQPLDLGRKFDLVVSLEVAEHLEEPHADPFVDSLIRHSDVILFSAAIKGQGGFNHVNEQFAPYWAKKFEARGFNFYDVIRPGIWWNNQVDWWYKQNIFLVSRHNFGTSVPHDQLLSGYHPDWYKGKEDLFKRMESGACGIKFGLDILKRAIKYKLNGKK